MHPLGSFASLELNFKASESLKLVIFPYEELLGTF